MTSESENCCPFFSSILNKKALDKVHNVHIKNGRYFPFFVNQLSR